VVIIMDKRFYEENGYVVIPGAVSRAACEAVIHAIHDFLGTDENNPDTWYGPGRSNAIVHMHQHQSLWDNRQNPRVHEAFAELLGTEKLLVSLDRAGFKPPISPDHPQHEDKGFIHWDAEMTADKPLRERYGVQGVLALTDTTEEMGGFRCVPGFHTRELIEEWRSSVPPEKISSAPDLSTLPAGFEVKPIPMQQGDLLIWTSLLLHGNGRNEGTQPRYAQYISMWPQPDNWESSPYRANRIECWRHRRAPEYFEKEIPEPYKDREQKYPPAQLTDLGRKLLGLEIWE
jgi:ectoine hydroxylase-related dioxygenase (phytanoyl-CoA dioxygenase family)